MAQGGLGQRWAKAGAALIALGALLIGVPWFLLQFANPAYLLQVDWVDALTVGADSRLILALLGTIAWVAWAVVALTILFEFVAVLSRQRIRIRLPGTGWLRPAIGALVLTAVAAPTMASADTGVAAPPVEAHLPPPVIASTEPGTPTSMTETAAAGRSYEVQPGDELWSIAERELGSGERWRDIVALNPGVTESSRLSPGATLQLPQDEPPAPTVVVEEGDTLWHIAEDQLGDPHRWPEIHQANLYQIQDPDQIDVGWELQLPPSADEAPPPPPEPTPGPAAAPGASGAMGIDDLRVPDPPLEERRGSAADAVRESFPSTPQATTAPTDGGASAVEHAATSPVDVHDTDADMDEDQTDYQGLLLPVGAALAGAVLLGVTTRRRTQVLARAVGRRLVPVPAQVARFWTALAHRSEDRTVEPTDPTPTTLVLGWEGDEAVQLDVEAERAVMFTGGEAASALGAAITGLACTPWASGAELIIVDGDDWVEALDDPRISGEPSTAEGLTRLARLCSERRLALRQHTLAASRADENLAEAFAPTVVIFLSPLSAAELDAVGDALALGDVGVSILAATADPLQHAFTYVHVGAEQATLRGRRFTPQLVSTPARRALVELFAATGQLDTEPAPWWKDDDDLPPNVLPLPRHGLDRPEERPMTMLSAPPHPALLLLGEVSLTGTAGTAPSRAMGQCMEYCAWLLQHPGATPTLMLRDLQVADATRRSNMSRLRTWLGADEESLPYLPDAYTGRIMLDDRVTSDWEQFTALLSGGVNMAGTAALRDALELVRGEPLGTFAFQWHWAQQLRAEMVAMIVDAACVLADRSLSQGDLDTALWAIAQGRLGAPLDDALAVREVEALAQAGRRADAEHAVVRLNRSLRADGRDLEPSLAIRIQESLRRSTRPGARRSR